MDDIANKPAANPQQQIEALWDGITQFGSTRSDEALHFMLGGLARMLDSQQAYWLGNVRMLSASPSDSLFGWRPRNVYHLHKCAKRMALIKERFHDLNKPSVPQIDPSVALTLREVGQFRVVSHHRMLPKSWYQSEFYKNFYQVHGISDTMVVTMPINDDVESYIGLQRIHHDTPYFSEADCELAAQAIRPMRWFHHQLALSHGLLLADKPLTSSERRVLSGLLSEATEAEIAAQLGLAHSTVHTYSKRICNKYGVRGRTGLSALWLGS